MSVSIYIKGHLIVNMRQKLITLDLTGFEIAKEIAKKHGSFSEWVRIQVRKYRDDNQFTLGDMTSDEYAATFKLRHGRWPEGYRQSTLETNEK
jgi:hypothetical protein